MFGADGFSDRQLNEIRGVVLPDGTIRMQTGEFSQANHTSAGDVVKFIEDACTANPQRMRAPSKKLKHQPKLKGKVTQGPST